MATVKEAVQSAVEFAQETLGPARTVNLQLEEVESGVVDGKDSWLITLSMINSSRFSGDRRDYKVFAVLKSNGEVLSMKIRELATDNA